MPLIQQVISLQQGGRRRGRAQGTCSINARPALVEWLAGINALIDYQEQLSQQETAEARKISTDFSLVDDRADAACVRGRRRRRLAPCVTSRRRSGPSRAKWSKLAESIRAGNLARRIELRRGDTSSVMAAMARMQQRLAEIVTKMRDAAQGVAAPRSKSRWVTPI